MFSFSTIVYFTICYILSTACCLNAQIMQKVVTMHHPFSGGIVSLQAWCSSPTVLSMGTTIHQMNRHIHTVFGDSSQVANWSTFSSPIVSIEQGTDVRPPIWSVVPQCLMCFKKKVFALIMGPISNLQHKCIGFAFVDDMDLCITHPASNAAEVAQHMQHSVMTREGLLTAMGGA